MCRKNDLLLIHEFKKYYDTYDIADDLIEISNDLLKTNNLGRLTLALMSTSLELMKSRFLEPGQNVGSSDYESRWKEILRLINEVNNLRHQ